MAGRQPSPAPSAGEGAEPSDIVLGRRDRHLKWRAFDRLERALMILCGVCLTGFTLSTLIDVVTRESGHPLLSLQEVTSAFFVYGIFIGTAVATRRNDHLFLSAITETHDRPHAPLSSRCSTAPWCSRSASPWRCSAGRTSSPASAASACRRCCRSPISTSPFRCPARWSRCSRVEQIVNGCATASPRPIGDGVLRDTGI